MAEAALAVLMPLLACLIAVPAGRHGAWLLWATAPFGLALACAAGWRVLADGPVLAALGGWAPPLGIALRLDGMAAAFICLSALVAPAAGAFAARWFDDPRRRAAFWPLFYALWAAVNAVFVGGDLFNLYVALELLTLAAVALVALDGKAASLKAAMRYLLFALFGSLAFLLGAALIYGALGTLDIGLGALRIAPAPAPAVHAGLALMTAGLIAKTALFPFHAWLPPAHGGAPAPASALLSALVVKAGFVILLRLWVDLAGPAAPPAVPLLLGLLGALAVLFGSLLALRQARLKMVVAYSTVAQIGYLFLVFPLVAGADADIAAGAWSGAILHAVAHGLAKAAMFLAAGAMILAAGGDRLKDMAGIGRAAPVAAFAFGLAAISLMGLPPTGGFIAKYLMLDAAFAGGRWGWGLVLLAGGLASAAYLFRPLARMVMEAPEGAAFRPVHWSLEVAPLLLALAALALGLAAMTPWRLLQIGAPFVGGGA